MGIWDIFNGNLKRDLEQINAEWAAAIDTKEVSYAQEQRNTPFSPFLLQDTPAVWTDPKSYSERAHAALQCGVSKACIMQRAIAISNIDVKVEGNPNAKQLMLNPNIKDGDLQTFLKNLETVLSIDGQVPLFWDTRVPDKAQLHTFRPDLVRNDVASSRYYYNPRLLRGEVGIENAQYVFTYDPITGKTLKAQERKGSNLVTISGGLQMLGYPDPRNSTDGMSPVSPIMRHIDLLKSIETLLAKKFNSGGTKAGFFEIQHNMLDDAQIEQIRAQFKLLNPDGGGNVLPSGVKYSDAQLTLAEMSVLEVRNQLINEICSALQVPPEMIGQAIGATYANVRGKDKIFYRNFIGPEAHWLVGQLQAGLRAYVDGKATLAVDETSVQHLEEDRLERASKKAQMKSYTRNEIRADLGDPALTDEQGGNEIVGAEVNMGQPEEKPKGPVDFNADAGNRGDNNE